MKGMVASLVPAAVPFVPFRTGRYDWTTRQHSEQAQAIHQSGLWSK